MRILREEPIRHLPNAPFRISRIFLANNETAYACRDCTATANSRGEIMIHRNEQHGARIGQKRPDKPVLDLVLPPRKDGPAPSDPLDMTFRELLKLMPSIGALGDLVEQMERERDAAIRMLGEHRRNQVKIDGYDEMLAELTGARIQLRQWANYEEIKAELYSLRAWKKKIIAKFSSLGFQLNEEDQ